MAVSKQGDATHIAILEGRNLIEYYVSRGRRHVPDPRQHLPRQGPKRPAQAKLAFVDIATKNAVLYRATCNTTRPTSRDRVTLNRRSSRSSSQADGAVSRSPRTRSIRGPPHHRGVAAGPFVVLVPNSDTYGISKRLPDAERKRLRKILDKARPKEHGIIVRTAAENVTAEEIQRDVKGLIQQWEQIEKRPTRPRRRRCSTRERDVGAGHPRGVQQGIPGRGIIDDKSLYDEVSSYVSVITPALADRVEFYDEAAEGLPIFERYHVHEQLHKALDRKVWLPSGGSLIIEHTEALTVIDVNTGKNVGSSSLEETVYRNNLEAAEEVAHQLRLRDIGGIIVIDFVDMEDKKNRDDVTRTLRQALARDKTRTQLYEIGELGLAEMTRKRIGEGLLESLSSRCPHCDGRGHVLEAGVR
ncbi:MAG: Rne/Rng family ribonuclease [Acidimicrobiales bacterium]